MKNRRKYLMAALTISLLMTGCQSGKGNLVEKEYKALDYVELGEYTGLEVQQIREKEELTEEEKEEAMGSALEEYAEDQDVTDRGAQNGDYLSVTYSCYQNGELIDETGDEAVDMQLGSCMYFDEEGEEQLLGVKAGEDRTVTFSTDDGEEVYEYRYEVKVLRVYETVLPELSDALAKEMGYASAKTMETAIYEDELESLNSDYQYSAKEELIGLVVNNSVIDGYPQSLYDETYEQLSVAYEDFLGMSMEEIFEGNEEAMKTTVEEALAQELAVEAIAEKENITVTREELDDYKAAIVSSHDYTDISELEAEYDDAVLADSLLKEKVQDFLLSNASITYVSEDEYYAYEGDEYGYTEDGFPEADGEDDIQ